MTVRIGKIELIAVQALHTEEARTLAEQRVPEQQGSVFQDLGREPTTIILEGLLFGEDVLSTLETLRTAHGKAEPLPFAADIAVGTDLTKVVIADFRVRQLSGYRDRYRFVMRLREHVEPPPSPDADVAPVNAAVQADAAAWGAGSVAAAGVLQDPASLPETLQANPDLLQHLDMNDLGDATALNADMIDAAHLDGMVESLGNADPKKAASFFDRLGKAGKLGEFLTKYAHEGLEFAKKIDPKKLSSLMTAFAGGLDFLKKLREVAKKAEDVVNEVKGFSLGQQFDPIIKVSKEGFGKKEDAS